MESSLLYNILLTVGVSVSQLWLCLSDHVYTSLVTLLVVRTMAFYAVVYGILRSITNVYYLSPLQSNDSSEVWNG